MILAEDEASLYLQATMTQVWAPRRQPPIVWVDPQRTKTSFFGMLDLSSGDEIETESPDLNGTATVQHLEQVLAAYPGKRILLFRDRTSWHKGPLVQALLAANPQLETIVFPVATPDLNRRSMSGK